MFITRIGQLLTMEGAALGLRSNVSLRVENGRVAEIIDGEVSRHGDAIDAGGQLVTPGLVDPHTHLIFAGSRADEFDRRARGQSYNEIAAAGGGILSTVRATRAASDEELIASTLARLDRFLRNGVVAVEAKSGYALSIEGELRLLRLLKRVAQQHVVKISPTLLAHVPPPDLPRQVFVDRFIAEAIPQAAQEKLAEAVDVYCDVGAFTLDETERILNAAKSLGLRLRVHAEQFTYTGAAELAAKLGAASVEHLEELSADGPALLARSQTVCNLLPGAALTLGLKWPNARALLDAGCLVALGTDCNPGSSLTESLPLMMSLACMQMKMSCEEAWRAATVNAARALGHDLGRVAVGASANLVIWRANDYREVIQHYGDSLVEAVIVDGQKMQF